MTTALNVFQILREWLQTTDNTASGDAFFGLYKLHTTQNSLISSEGWVALATSAFESLYGAQFILSTQLIKPIFTFHFTDATPQLLRNKTISSKPMYSHRLRFVSMTSIGQGCNQTGLLEVLLLTES